MPALAGIEMLNRGVITMSCWTLIIDQSWLSDAEIKILAKRLA